MISILEEVQFWRLILGVVKPPLKEETDYNLTPRFRV